jgi:hypothetical protein
MVVVAMSLTNNFRSGPSYSIDVAGLPEATAMLQDAAARGEDMRPAMARIKVLFTEGHKANFDSKGGFLGTPWPDNTDETKARKSREGIPALNDVLVGSGDLEEALAGGKGARTRVSKGSVSVGVAPFYAIFAQGGAKGGSRRGTEEKRPILGITAAETEESISILTDYLMGR